MLSRHCSLFVSPLTHVQSENIVKDEVTSWSQTGGFGGHELKRLRKLLWHLLLIDVQISTDDDDNPTIGRWLAIARLHVVSHARKR